MRAVRITPALAVAIGCGAGCGDAGREVTEGSIRVAGSDAAFPLVQAAADSFARIYEGAEVLARGGGSVEGLLALLNREADLVVMSRDLSEAERSAARKARVDVALYPFARDGLALITHPHNSVYALAFEEARALFAGEIGDWSEVGGKIEPVLVYKSSERSGAAGFMRETLLDGAPFGAAAVEVASTAAIVDSVARHPGAIGYAGMAEADERVKPIPLSPKEGGPLIPLNGETVYRQSYPLTRTFYFGARGIPEDDLVSGFVSFVMSTRGQRIVLEAGFVPATVPVRINYEG